MLKTLLMQIFITIFILVFIAFLSVSISWVTGANPARVYYILSALSLIIVSLFVIINEGDDEF